MEKLIKQKNSENETKPDKVIIPLIIEQDNTNNKLWGRIEYNEDLLIDAASTIEELQDKMASLLHKDDALLSSEFEFDIYYDLTALFSEKNYLNLTAVANRLGINRSLLAQYAAGIKLPSLERASEIEHVIHGFGNELRSIKLAVKHKPVQVYESKENRKEAIAS